MLLTYFFIYILGLFCSVSYERFLFLIFNERFVWCVELFNPWDHWLGSSHSGMCTGMLLVSESHDVGNFVVDPFSPDFICDTEINFWIISSRNKICDVILLEWEHVIGSSVQRAHSIDPLVNICLSLAFAWQLNLVEDQISAVPSLSIKHNECVALLNHSEIHQLWIRLPDASFIGFINV